MPKPILKTDELNSLEFMMMGSHEVRKNVVEPGTSV